MRVQSRSPAHVVRVEHRIDFFGGQNRAVILRPVARKPAAHPQRNALAQKVKIAVRNETGGIEHDLLQARALRPFGNRAAKTRRPRAVKLERQVERRRVLPAKRLRHGIGIGDIGMDGRQIRERRACHRIGAAHPGRNGKSTFEQRSHQRLSLGAEHLDDVVEHGAAQSLFLPAQKVAIHPLGACHRCGAGRGCTRGLGFRRSARRGGALIRVDRGR